jgi:glyoxylate carboligase
MGGAIDAVNEFGDLAMTAEDAPTAILPMQDGLERSTV